MKILFLCMGNICRSPAAHCVFQHLVDQAGLGDHYEIDSAGTIGYHEGAPPDERMQASMRKRQIPIIGRSRPLTHRDLMDFDLILAMDKANLYDARSMTRDEERKKKIRLFTEYCRKHKDLEVPDPYYGGSGGFERVLDLVEDGCAGLLADTRPDA
ncbi:MAG: low molecular weight protein-tyrosine-phosphatase [Puniceicoccales bacterium]